MTILDKNGMKTSKVISYEYYKGTNEFSEAQLNMIMFACMGRNEGKITDAQIREIANPDLTPHEMGELIVKYGDLK